MMRRRTLTRLIVSPVAVGALAAGGLAVGGLAGCGPAVPSEPFLPECPATRQFPRV